MCTGAEAIIVSSVIGAGAAMATKPKAVKPSAAPKAPPPVKTEDPNVQAAAKNKQRQLSAASRASARNVSSYGSTLG